MKKTFGKIISLMLAVLLTLSVFPIAGLLPFASAETYSGTCGDNLKWSLDKSTGVLNITGSGKMNDYQYVSYSLSTYAPWYSYCSYIKTVKIEDGVTSIGNHAFYKCSSLTSVNIPDGVTSIGGYAFCFCSKLTSVEIPDGVTSIGGYAFCCSSLKSVNIPDGVTSIGHSAFQSCSSLTSVNIPDGVTSIGEDAFGVCSSLTSITIPDSVTSIGEYAFEFCSSLTSITIPDSVTRIGEDAFADCSSLKKITILNPDCTICDSVCESGETIPSSAVIYGYSNSTAQGFANDHNRTFRTICSKHTFSSSPSLVLKGSSASLRLSCSICGYFRLKKADKLSTTTTKATCTQTGEKVYKATAKYNGTTYTASKTETIPKKAHKYGSYVPVKKATLTADGTKKKTCSVCGKVFTSAVKKVSKISLTTSAYAYTGENRTIKFTVKASSGKTLVKGTDYTVSYPTGRKSIGKHTVKITLKGNYSGTKTLSFKIRPAKVTGLKRVKVSGYDLKLQWNSVKNAEKYQVQYYNTNKKAWETIGTTTGLSLKMKKLTCDYKWRIRAYKTVNGTKYYGLYSDTFTTKA